MKKITIAVVGAIIGIGLICSIAPQANAKENDEAEIKALEQRVADGAKARDVDAIMENFVPDETLVVFDVIPPRQYVGADAYHKDWEGFLGTFDGPITFENSDMTVMSDGKMAFAHYITHVAGKGKDGNPIDLTTRSTDVLRKINGKWVIVHEHVSVPVDLATGKGDLASKP
jgi:ketosteroid isomerase-like protein